MRTNDDQWTITSSVGRTALLVALGRALETDSETALISDPFAAEFVADSGETDLDPHRVRERLIIDDDPALARAVDLMTNMMAARTQRIDTALATANADGCLQVVILASGLDARAFRLDWRPGTTLFEIDQPAVLEFKDRTLRRLRARSAARRTTVACDLRQDWLSALRGAGLRTDVPTAWLCEGLLPYLQSDDQQRLLATIGAASPAGSVLVFDAPRGRFDPESVDIDSDVFGVDIDELFLDTGDFLARDWLDSHGWRTSADSIGALLTSYGRTSAVFTEHHVGNAGDGPTSMGDMFDMVVALRD